jgi:glycosyltransferase involved in cell wall biosynthesis
MSVAFQAHCLAFSCNSYTGFGPSMTFHEVLRSFGAEGIDVTAFTPRLRRRPDNGVRQVPGLPSIFNNFPWRYVRRLGAGMTEAKLQQAVRSAGRDHFVYSFPDLSMQTVTEIGRAGLPLVREMIGVHRGTARRVRVEEPAREGLPPFDSISEQSVDDETEWLRHAQAIFAPNAEVTRSLLEFGVPEEKIIDTAYGWSPNRFPTADQAREFDKGLVLLFVGRVSFAKGAHHLLRAWHRAGCPGRLVLAGNVEAELENRFAVELAHPSVERLGFVNDLGPIYSSANAFALPTLFEGGPQVTLEAAAHGLGLLVSPMGTARLVRDGSEGQVIEPQAIADWAEAIQAFAKDLDRVKTMGDRARIRAQDFVWDKLSRERARSIKSALSLSNLDDERAAATA